MPKVVTQHCLEQDLNPRPARTERKRWAPMLQISVNAGVTTLDIREVFSEDCGTYAVIARNMGGEARTSCHVSLVEVPAEDAAAVRAGARRPVQPLFVQPLESRSVLEGNHTRLECVVTGYPEPEVNNSLVINTLYCLCSPRRSALARLR